MRSDTVSTQRLLLRPFTLEDLKPLHQILSSPAVHRYMPRREPWALEKVQRWIEMAIQHWAERNYGWWAVELKETGELTGWCGLKYLDDTEEVEVLYLFGEDYWGRGFATEAALATVRYAFETAGLEELVGIVHPENIASRRVLEKIGMAFNQRTHYFGIDVDTYFMKR